MKNVFITKCQTYDMYKLKEIFESVLDNTESIKKIKKGEFCIIKNKFNNT